MNIAIFASGAGSNAAEIIKQLPSYLLMSEGCIKLIVTNNDKAGVLNIATTNNIEFAVINLKQKTDPEAFEIYKEVLQKHNIDFIVLAGYLKKIPSGLTKLYPNKIVNIHPALLPKYGGAGMYGANVHSAVVAAKEKESGITIHFVDEFYDHGKIIFQAKCPVAIEDTPVTVAKKVQALEYENYTKVIADVLKGLIKSDLLLSAKFG
jgi:phosphoribosylglycinamide formyltransferase 1